MTTTNNAQRLVDSLIRFQVYSDDVKMKSVWAQEFRINPDALDKIAMVPAKLIALTYKIDNNINNLSNLNRKDLYLSNIRKVRESLFNLTTIHAASTVKTMFPQGIIDNLSIISDILNSNNLNEKIVPDEKLEGIFGKISELAEEISKSDLETSDKEFLLELLSIIQNSLSEYVINGVESFKEGVEISFGMIIRKKLTVANASESEAKNSAYKKIIDLVKDVNAIYTLATNTVAALPEAFDKVVGLLK
ncbi:hypothetical protein DLM76_21095 [Leptospira yasudae]|uniref:hypothetical protein n=1 Tax=Leptospira yasudae TaxID=2202201 RepID=UPI000E5A0E58|nr:hypothetical protein [Leptospira yasudae]RHX89517.1 hypothetical protein DLM76_21095 [Leptospira yasudae]